MIWVSQAGILLALASIVVLVGCGRSSSSTFLSKGSFTASGVDSGSVSAIFTGMSSYLEMMNLGPSIFTIGANNGDGTSTGTFTNPSGVTTYTVTTNIFFTGPPTTEMTLTNANSCGDVLISSGSAAVSKLGDFEASVPGASCGPIADGGIGSWTLALTSISPFEMDSGNQNCGACGSYLAHGTFMATIPDGMGDTGMINFDF